MLLEEALAASMTVPMPETLEEEQLETEDAPLSTSQANAIWKQVQKGVQAKVLKVMDSMPLAPVTVANWQEAWSKICPGNITSAFADESAVQDCVPPAEAWQKAMTKLKANKAADPGGWTHETLHAVCRYPVAQHQMITLCKHLPCLCPHLSCDC